MKIEDLNSKKNPFSVPDGYFDHLTERVMERLPDLPVEDASAKTVDIRKNRFRWIGWTAAIAAAVVAAVFFISPTKGVDEGAIPTSTQLADNTVEMEYDQEALEYAMIDYNDIYCYLADNNF